MDSTSALVVLTAALVLVTGYYAYQNRRMVGEMRQARSTSVLPRLALSIRPLGGGIGFLRLSNVGPGPALHVRATITLEPDGFDIQWDAHVVAPGEFHEFIPQPPGEKDVSLASLDRLVERFTHAALSATYEDALGDRHETNERIEAREWWRGLRDSHELLSHDYGKEAVSELEKIRKALERVARGQG
jgi:hypothetical protein